MWARGQHDPLWIQVGAGRGDGSTASRGGRGLQGPWLGRWAWATHFPLLGLGFHSYNMARVTPG